MPDTVPTIDERTLPNQFLAARTQFRQDDPVAFLNGLGAPAGGKTETAAPGGSPVTPSGAAPAAGRQDKPAGESGSGNSLTDATPQGSSSGPGADPSLPLGRRLVHAIGAIGAAGNEALKQPLATADVPGPAGVLLQSLEALLVKTPNAGFAAANEAVAQALEGAGFKPGQNFEPTGNAYIDRSLSQFFDPGNVRRDLPGIEAVAAGGEGGSPGAALAGAKELGGKAGDLTAENSTLRQVLADTKGGGPLPGGEAGGPKKIIDLSGMGSAMTNNLYQGLFDALKKGEDTFAGIKDPVIAQAKPAFDRGDIKSADDLKAWVAANYGTKPGQQPGGAVSGTEAPAAKSGAFVDKDGKPIDPNDPDALTKMHPAEEAPSGKPSGAPAKPVEPPPFIVRGAEPGAAFKATPELEAKAARYVNGTLDDNPIQNSLRAMSNSDTAQQTIEDIAKFIEPSKVKPDDVTAMNAYSLQTTPLEIGRTVNEQLKGMDDRMAAFNIAINSAAEETQNYAKAAHASGSPEDYALAIRAVAAQLHIEGQWSEAGTSMGRAFRQRQEAFDSRGDFRDMFKSAIQNVGQDDLKGIVDRLALTEDPRKVAPFVAALRWMRSRDGLMYGWYNVMLSNYRVIQKKVLSDSSMLAWNIATHYAAEKFGSGAVASGETAAMLHGYVSSLGDAVKIAGRALRTGQAQFDPMHQTLEGQQYTRPWLFAQGQKAWSDTSLTEKTVEALRGALPTSVMGGVDDFYKTINYRGEAAALARREATKQIAEEVQASGKAETGEALAARNRARGNPNALTPEEIGTAEVSGQSPNEMAAQRPQGLPITVTHADEIEQRAAEIMNAIPAHIHEEALANADRTLFVEPLSRIGEAISSATDHFNIPIPYRASSGDVEWAQIPLGRMILPFTKRPFNIIREAARNSPIAPAMPSYQAAIAAGGAAKDLARARAGLGSFVALTMATLAATKLMTGKGPSDRNANQKWQEAGNRPYQFYGFNYRNAEPWGTIAAPIADSFDALRFVRNDADGAQIANSLITGLGGALLDASPLMGLQQFLDGISAPGARDQKWFDSLAMSAEPSLLQAWKANQDPWLRAHDGLLSSFWARLPYKSFDEPLEYDEWGDPIPARTGFLPFWTSGPGKVPDGYDLNSAQTTPAKQWIWDNRRAFPNNEEDGARFGISKVPGVISESAGGITARYKLSTDQQERWQYLTGQGAKIDGNPRMSLGFKDTANRLVMGNHPDDQLQAMWNKGAPEDKARMLLMLHKDYRELAKQQMMGAKGEYPEIAEALNAQLHQQANTIRQGRAGAAPGNETPPPGAAAGAVREPTIRTTP